METLGEYLGIARHVLRVNGSFSRNNILGSNLFFFNYLKILLHCSLAVRAAVGKSSDNWDPVFRR